MNDVGHGSKCGGCKRPIRTEYLLTIMGDDGKMTSMHVGCAKRRITVADPNFWNRFPVKAKRNAI